ncbi:MAG: C40 family peptidase, partial [Acidimicrobiales bacterium]
GPAQGPPPAGGSAQQTAVAWARQELGRPYVWAGSGPDVFDCSGLVMYVYSQAGVSFPHSAQLQYDDTSRVSSGELIPGDLVFFGGGPSGVSHVGIYVGGGQMIHAPYTGTVVQYSGIYWPDLVGFGRVG